MEHSQHGLNDTSSLAPFYAIVINPGHVVQLVLAEDVHLLASIGRSSSETSLDVGGAAWVPGDAKTSSRWTCAIRLIARGAITTSPAPIRSGPPRNPGGALSENPFEIYARWLAECAALLRDVMGSGLAKARSGCQRSGHAAHCSLRRDGFLCCGRATAARLRFDAWRNLCKRCWRNNANGLIVSAAPTRISGLIPMSTTAVVLKICTAMPAWIPDEDYTSVCHNEAERGP